MKGLLVIWMKRLRGIDFPRRSLPRSGTRIRTEKPWLLAGRGVWNSCAVLWPKQPKGAYRQVEQSNPWKEWIELYLISSQKLFSKYCRFFHEFSTSFWLLGGVTMTFSLSPPYGTSSVLWVRLAEALVQDAWLKCVDITPLAKDISIYFITNYHRARPAISGRDSSAGRRGCWGWELLFRSFITSRSVNPGKYTDTYLKIFQDTI